MATGKQAKEPSKSSKKKTNTSQNTSRKAASNKSDQNKSAKKKEDPLNWEDPKDNLTWSLLDSIEQDEDMMRGLFPGSGGNTSTQRGGGKKKIEYHWALAKILFENHSVQGPKLAEKAMDIKGKLGQTGGGIERADQLDGASEHVRNLWEELVTGPFPYYERIMALIQNNPNKEPPEVNNTESNVDFGSIMLEVDDAGSDRDPPGLDDEDEDEEEDDDDNQGSYSSTSAGEDSGLESADEGADGLGEISDEDEHSEKTQKKRKQSSTPLAPKQAAKKAKKTPARRAASSPAAAKQTPTMKRKSKDSGEFDNLHLEEEKTHRKQLEVEALKVRLETTKVKGKVALKEVAIRNEHKFRMARVNASLQIQLAQIQRKQAPVSPFDLASSTSSSDIHQTGTDPLQWDYGAASASASLMGPMAMDYNSRHGVDFGNFGEGSVATGHSTGKSSKS
ncbi:uncharacterized protein BXZ73DRAFT_79483 [Epithele typhae]|uniref:uncharacterized protein n=1 Tax=Epithele typhae TaxID=378194 RepID=UPI002008CCF0|nr:uncharacterized protein BXZ73DRAFT_79483 [Epithele typhae]KAH9923417.1 hypothetical protein BXZ73DRAFT_79483 [Epithele typhae]